MCAFGFFFVSVSLSLSSHIVHIQIVKPKMNQTEIIQFIWMGYAVIKWCEWSDYDSATSKGSAYSRWYIKVTFGDCIGSTSILIWILLFCDKNSGRKNYSRLICLPLNCCCYYVTHAMTNFIETTIFGVLVEAFDWLSRQNVARILTFKWNAPLILIQLKNIIQ